MNSTGTPPLVSVIVRTMGRATLPRALASIGAQTWRPLEIVLVDAAGSGLALERQADIPVRVVGGGPYDRPHAANAGLAAARGAWLTFLGRERVFGGPFDRAALLRSNYIAIHAVLFSRAFVDQGVRFDETLATFEDWDFWLQLATRTDFAFSGQPTAIYRASAGASGAGAGPNLDRDAVLAQRARLMRKWQAS